MAKQPVDVLCIYRVKKGKEAEFKKLLKKHGPALKSAGLSSDMEPWCSRDSVDWRMIAPSRYTSGGNCGCRTRPKRRPR